MRGLLACSIVALLAVPVFGRFSEFHGTMELTTAGAVDMGDHWEVALGDLTETAVGSGMFYLDVMVSSTDPEGMSAFGITLDSNPEKLAYDDISLWDYAGYHADYGTRPGMPNNFWSNGAAEAIPAGVMPMPGPTANAEIGTINQQNVPGQYDYHFAVDGLASWVKVGIPTGDVDVTIGPNAAVVPPYIGDHLFNSMTPRFNNFTFKPLIITPEPASALLLLGVPFLRRRR